MAFDISTAKPAQSGGFDISSAQPVAPTQPESLGPTSRRDRRHQRAQSRSDLQSEQRRDPFEGLPAETIEEIESRFPIPELDRRRGGPSARQSAVNRRRTAAELEQIRLINPFMAELIEDTGGAEAFAIGAGRGLTNIGRAVRLVDPEDEITAQSIEGLRTQRPAAVTAGEIAGESAPFLAVGGPLTGLARTTAQKVITGAALGAAEGGLVTAGRGGSAKEVALGTILGGLTGGAAPVVASRLSSGPGARSDRLNAAKELLKEPTRKEISEAVKGAVPSSGDLRQASKAIYSELSDSGVSVKPESFERFIDKAVKEAKDVGLLESKLGRKLTPQASGIIDVLDDMKTGAISFDELEGIRRAAQNSAGVANIAGNFADEAINISVVDSIDDFMKGIDAKSFSKKSNIPIGFDAENIMTHSGGQISEIKKGGVFDGIFAKYGEESSGGLGKENLQTSFVPRNGKVAGTRDADLDFDKSMDFLKKEFKGETEDFYDEIYEWTANDNSTPWDNNILAKYGFDDPGEASWEAQRIRGQIAANQDMDVIEMLDETGTSLLIPHQTKARKLSDISKNESVKNVGQEVAAARNLWGRARKSELLEEAVDRAKSQASGFENGIRKQFLQIIQNKKKSRFFSKDELDAMKAVERGTTTANTFRRIGKLGWGEGKQSTVLNALGSGSIGGGAGILASGGPLAAGIGLILLPTTGTISGKLARNLTLNSAKMANQLVRAGSDANNIAKVYLRNTPLKQRSADDLASLLMRPDLNLSLIKSSNPIIAQAATKAEQLRQSVAASSAAVAIPAAAQEEQE